MQETPQTAQQKISQGKSQSKQLKIPQETPQTKKHKSSSELSQEELQESTGQSYHNIEDETLKIAATYWGEGLLKKIGVDQKLQYIAPTESVHLEMRTMYEDFNYVMEDGGWFHLEFESDSVKKKDLKRFREYEAVTSRTFDTAVTTCVLCSATVEKPMCQFTEGINTYKVQVVRVKDDRAEDAIQKFQEDKESGKVMTSDDYVPLILSPLMAGSLPQKDRIMKVIEILKKADQDLTKEDVRKMLAVTYAMANKFLKDDELKEVKEVIGMTRLGEMIFMDGRNEGRNEGLTLIEAIMEAGETFDIKRMKTDEAYYQELVQKYHIQE